MFQALRTRFGIPGVISVIALVFAMAGGAFAANNLGGSDSSDATASAKGKPGPRGKTGKTGPAGPAGPQGPTGPNGKDGANGANGTAGAVGTSVTSAVEPKGANCSEGGSKFVAGAAATYACNGKGGKNGEDGANGADGLPGPQGPPGPTCNPSGECLLPPGATETGLWSASTPAGFFQLWTAISFPLGLSTAPTKHFVTFEQAENAEVPECPGTSESPKATPGNLCLYEATLNNLEPPLSDSAVDLRSGLSMRFGLLDVEKPARTNGAWAVTACPQGGCLP